MLIYLVDNYIATSLIHTINSAPSKGIFLGSLKTAKIILCPKRTETVS